MECKDCLLCFREIKDGTLVSMCICDFINDSLECKEARYPEVRQ